MCKEIIELYNQLNVAEVAVLLWNKIRIKIDQRNELKSPLKNLQYMMEDADENEQPPLIFDNGDHYFSKRCNFNVFNSGTGLVKCGFAGEEAPRAVFPCIVGRAKQNAPIMAGMGNARSGTGRYIFFRPKSSSKEVACL